MGLVGIFVVRDVQDEAAMCLVSDVDSVHWSIGTIASLFFDIGQCDH